MIWSSTEYLIHLHPLSGEGAFGGRGCIFCAVLGEFADLFSEGSKKDVKDGEFELTAALE